jgi:photosystem II stability/assembly factor-like uncharacterized protein
MKKFRRLSLVLVLMMGGCDTGDGSAGGPFTVNFNPGEGTGTPPAAQTLAYGQEIVLPGSAGMSAPGLKTFKGWSTGSTSYRPGARYRVTGDLTLTALWGNLSISRLDSPRIFDAPAKLRRIAYKPGGAGAVVAVAGADNGGLAWSPDYETWIEAGYKLGSRVNGIAFGKDRFVAVGDGGRIAVSSDGKSWSGVPPENHSFDDIYDIVYHSGKFVAVGRQGRIAHSTDGQVWHAADAGGISSNLRTVAGGSAGLVAAGNESKAASSSDAATWTAVSPPGLGFSGTNIPHITGAAAQGTHFVVVGNYGKASCSSDSGSTWTASSSTTFSSTATINAVAYDDARGIFILGGDGGKASWSADNGAAWTALDGGTWGSTGISRIVKSPDALLVIGENGVLGIVE